MILLHVDYVGIAGVRSIVGIVVYSNIYLLKCCILVFLLYCNLSKIMIYF